MLEPAGAACEIAIELGDQPLAQRQPDQAAEQAQAEREHRRVPDGEPEADGAGAHRAYRGSSIM